MPSSIQSGNCEFSIRLGKVIASQDEEANLCFSPASISLVLAMCHMGAEGDTKRQIKDAIFGKEASILEVENWSKKLLALETCNDADAAILKFANRLYTSDKFPLIDGFIQQVTESFKSLAVTVDFESNAAEVAREVNQWVEEVTNGMIREIVPEGCPTADVILMLINALYFKAPWWKQFCEYDNETKKFHINENEEVDVEMMRMDVEQTWFENDDVQVLELPYSGICASMILILPKERFGLKKVLHNLNGARFLGWLDNLTKEDVQIELPRFKIEQSLKLNEPLKMIGVQDAFDIGSSDFSKMTKNGSGHLAISEIFHKAHIEVDENGTEAAAATVAQEIEKCLVERLEEREQKHFIADQPFMFFLTAGPYQSRSILFFGQYYGKEAKVI